MANEKSNNDIFNKFLAKKKQEEKERADRGTNSGSNFTPQYEDIKYVDLTESPAMLRFVGNPPMNDLAYQRRPSDAKELFISKIKDDNGKIMYLTLPLRSELASDNHIMHRLIADVMKKEYVNKKRVEVGPTKWPESYKIVSKGGYKDGDPGYTFANGWLGKQMLLINCIDRKDSWCADNKHTKVVSKKIGHSINQDGDEVEWPEKGVNSFGFLNILTDIMSTDGNWEDYDVCIRKNTDPQTRMTNPYKMWNASKFLSPQAIQMGFAKDLGLTEDEQKLAVLDPISDEELNYERYDLDKCFHVTPYSAILKRLGNSIKKIDAELTAAYPKAPRTYYDELTKLAEKEKAEWEAMKAEQDAAAPAAESTATEAPVETPTESAAPSFDSMPSVQESAPVTRTVVGTEPATKLTPEKLALLKGWDTLSADEKAMIVDVEVNADGSLKNVVYSDDAPACLPCPEDQGGCGFGSPSIFSHCPVCGKRFS